MLQRLLGLLTLVISLTALAGNPQVEFETNHGNFVLELYPDKAPRTVDNFLQYVNNGYYAGTVFERAIPNFVAQGGGLTETLEPKPALEPIASESNNGLLNLRGSVAMVHGQSADSATSRFFVNLADNRILNFVRHEQGLEGYTVFARVVRGLDVLMRIAAGPTMVVGNLRNVPQQLPVIRSVHLLDQPLLAAELPPETQPELMEKTKPNKLASSKIASSKLTKKGNTSGKTAN